GMTFDPQFSVNHLVYIFYTAGSSSLNPPASPKNRVSRFLASGDELLLGSEEILVDNIESDSGSDNGGGLKFGQDGKLYIATGDGGLNVQLSQSLTSLAGKLLRVNSDGSAVTDNPFFGQAPKRPEIWAYGFRNPFRFTFRPNTNIPFLADVGQVTWEELNVVIRGGNYGWPLAEGTSSNPNLLNPAFSYDHVGMSKCICGGVFTKSTKFPSTFQNRYVYGEYKLQFLNYVDFNDANQMVGQGTFGPAATGPVDFEMGPDGNLYYVALGAKTVQRISYQPVVNDLNIPTPLDGGTGAQCTLGLNAVAPVGSLRVNLGSSSPKVTVPAHVTLLSGATTVGFALTSQPVLANTDVTISASVPGSTFTKNITLKPNSLKGLYVGAPSVVSGLSVSATVGLLSPASQASVVAMSADSGLVSLPAQVSVPASALSKSFTVLSLPVAAQKSVVLRADWAGTSRTRALTLLPASLAGLSATPNPIRGGTSGTGTVTLNGAGAGQVVTLTDNTSLISTPSSVTLAGSATTASFVFTTLTVSTTVTRTVTANLSGVTRTVQVTLIR
ncbi:MAG: PQQ-dependent sugar dehydrogenase, partial [Fimbriimonadaceae bacterium]